MSSILILPTKKEFGKMTEDVVKKTVKGVGERLTEKAAAEYTADPSESQDIVLLLEGKPIVRKYTIGKMIEISLKDLKSREYLLARRLATVQAKDDGLPVIDYSRLPVYNLALAIVDLKIGEKTIELPNMGDIKNPDNARDFLGAIDDRCGIIENWIPSVFGNAIEKFEELMAYVAKISEPEALENF